AWQAPSGAWYGCGTWRGESPPRLSCTRSPRRESASWPLAQMVGVWPQLPFQTEREAFSAEVSYGYGTWISPTPSHSTCSPPTAWALSRLALQDSNSPASV